MTALVVLNFACCRCDLDIGATVKCVGKGLAAGARCVAAVKLACPHCGGGNQVYFEPSGTVRDVVPCRTPRYVLEPSVN